MIGAPLSCSPLIWRVKDGNPLLFLHISQVSRVIGNWSFELMEWEGRVCLVSILREYESYLKGKEYEFVMRCLIKDNNRWEKVITTPIDRSLASRTTAKFHIVSHHNSLFVAPVDSSTLKLKFSFYNNCQRITGQFNWQDQNFISTISPFTPNLFRCNYLDCQLCPAHPLCSSGGVSRGSFMAILILPSFFCCRKFFFLG
ncbi:hypothetical protein AMTRI_Chr08g167370 [Amborella trichopoda]